MLGFQLNRLEIPSVLALRPRLFRDERGAFVETFRAADFRALGIPCNFVQDNQSRSTSRGTLRGLHFQRPPAAQAKLVRVAHGAVFDVAVDLRRDSATFGRWCSRILTADEGEMLFIPVGFAHGFCTLAADTVVIYRVDSYYSPQHDAGIRWNDPSIGIDWPVGRDDVVLSHKDASLPMLRDIETPFYEEADGWASS